MVYIKRLEIRGFKSFERSVTIDFVRGFNAISGQNGSGKSNIMDAIRFVLGENSPKSLRESKMTSLINEKAKIKQARVSIQIANDDHALPLQEDTVTITRELLEDGSQRYYINGKKTTRNAVIDLLLSSKISYDGINIVPQGALNRIAEMTPNERRLMLEEIVGIKAYDERKNEAMQRLREADSQLAVIFAKLDEKRESMIKLEHERNDQLRYETLQRELLRYRKAIIADRISRKTQELESLKREEEKLVEENNELAAEIQRLMSAGSSGMDQKTEAMITELSDSRARYNSYESELAFIRKRLSQLSDEKARISEAISSLNSMKAQLQEQIKEASDKKEALRRQQMELLRKIDEKEGELRSARGEYERARADMARLREEYEKVIGLLGRIRERKEEISSRIAELGNSLKYEQERMDQLIKSIESMREVQTDLEAEISALNGASSRESEKVSELLERLKKLSAYREAIADSLRQANEVIIKSIKEISVEEAFNRLTSKMSPGAAAELFDTGVFRGYLGRLGDLIQAKQGYRVQVSAAIEALGNPFVFESLDQRLENAMKNLPRTRILILSMFGDVNLRACENSIVNVMIYDEKLEPMVMALFGNVCLRESDCCSSWIRDDGAIFGKGIVELGYITSLKLSDRINVRRLREIRRTINRLSAAVREKSGALNKLMNEIHSINVELSKRSINRDVSRKQAEALLRILKMEGRIVEGFSRRLEAMKSSIEQKRRNAERLAEALSLLSSKQQEMESKLNQINSAIKSIELGAIEERIGSIQGEIMKMNQEQVEQKRIEVELQAKIEELNARLEVTEESLGQQMQRLSELDAEGMELTRRIDEIEASKKELEAKISSLEKELSSILGSTGQNASRSQEEIRSEVLKKLKDNEKRLSKTRSSIERLAEELQELNAEYQSINVEQYDLFGNYEQIIAELQAELNELQLRLNRMAVHDYREYYISYKDSSVRRNELEKDRESIVNFIEEIERQKKEAFMKAFEKIDRELRSVFREIANGEAWLELENPDNPFSGGVFMLGKFGDKMPRESASLSGGEKAVISVAFLMALQSAYMSPFYLFDEIDANMDAANAERLGEFLNKWGKGSQIILVSLRDTVISKAQNIIGVYEKDGSSFIARLNMEKIVNGRGKGEGAQDTP